MLDMLFAHILDMSLRGGVVIVAVMLVRLLLKKAPKVFSYALWGVVLFRLLCPVSIQLPVSVVPDMESVAEGYRFAHDPITVIDAGKAVYQAADDAANRQLDVQQVYIDVPSSLGGYRLRAATLSEIFVMAGQFVWLAGVAAFLIYSIISCIKLRRKLIGATPLRGNVFLADHIDSPFVLGLIKPKIYLPSALREGERGYIIAHERHHVRRLDHIIKPVAFFALTLHWFNPLVWLGYVLFCKDMEMSCDEAVIKKMGADIRADYSASLLNLATGKPIIGITPLAFGEGDTKSRIENLSKWKKPLLWVTIVSVAVCLVAGVCLVTDPTPKANKSAEIADTQTDPIQPGGTSPDEVFDITISFAGYTRAAEVYADAQNAHALADSSGIHLPIYKFDTKAEMDAFISDYGKFFSLDQSYDEIPSFYGVVEQYDEAYFNERTLMLVYIPSSNSAARYKVDSVQVTNTLCVHMIKKQDSYAFTNDMVGWFAIIGVPDSMVQGCSGFDADLNNPSLAGGNIGPQVTRVEKTERDTVCYIQTYLPGTDFSQLSDKVQNKVKAEWNTYDNMTPWEHALSSHLFGIVYMDAASWEQCEADLGIEVYNPIMGVSWLTATDSYGGISTQPNAPHVETTVYATAMSDRQIDELHITAGYKAGDVRVMLHAKVHRESGNYSTGLTGLSRANFVSENLTTGSGAPVLVTGSDENVDYSNLTAWWVQENVFYLLRVVGQKNEDVQVRTTLEKLLAEI